MSLAPPVTSRLVTRSALRSAASFHMPPRREMSQGTAVESVKSADWARQSKGRKRRRCCTTTVLPLTVISGTGPTKLAWYRSVSDGSPLRRHLRGALGELEAPRGGAAQRRGALRRPVLAADLERQLDLHAALARRRARGALRRERGDLGLVHAARAAQEVTDARELGCLTTLEEPPGRELHLALDARPDLARRDGGDHQHATPVRRVGHAVGVPAPLQPVEHRGDRSRREAALFGELAGGHAAAPVQDAEAAQVGAVEAELERDGLVQLVAGAAQFVELDADLVDEGGAALSDPCSSLPPGRTGTLWQGPRAGCGAGGRRFDSLDDDTTT